MNRKIFGNLEQFMGRWLMNKRNLVLIVFLLSVISSSMLYLTQYSFLIPIIIISLIISIVLTSLKLSN
jgi:hypothetical protein